MFWDVPLKQSHDLSGSTDSVVTVGGTGDFDSAGALRNPGKLLAQIPGAVANLEASLNDEVCGLRDVVRVKAFCTCVDANEYWAALAALAKLLPADPAPAIIVHPVPLQPFDGQKIQLQGLAVPGWREAHDIRVVESRVPSPVASLFERTTLTEGLRAGEFIALAGQSALDENAQAPHKDGIEQTHVMFERLGSVLTQLGASFQDSVKKEGYYFGTTMEEWAAMAKVRASYFHEPGPVATVVPCHELWPKGLLTRVELLAMRATRSGFDKYIPRDDCWPDRVWDWPIPVPYRQGIRLRNTIWTGGHVPFEPGTNSGKGVHKGDLPAQTRLTMRYIDDILRGFGATTSDLQLLVCYFESDGQQSSTQAFAESLAACVAGPLPPVTLVPQPMMHSEEMGVEIWGVGRSA